MAVRNRSLSEQVIDALSSHADVDPLELRPLYEVVDPDALDALFDATTEPTPPSNVVRFRYEGYTISAHGDGEIRITEAPPSTIQRQE